MPPPNRDLIILGGYITDEQAEKKMNEDQQPRPRLVEVVRDPAEGAEWKTCGFVVLTVGLMAMGKAVRGSR